MDIFQVYNEFHVKIFRYVLSRVGDVEAARDITAEVFFKMHKNRWKLGLTSTPISAWLFRVAGNEISSFFRKKKYKPLCLEAELDTLKAVPSALRGDLQEEILQAQEQINRNAVYFKIHKQLLKLPNKYQEVIVLHYLEEQTVPEISRLLDKKEGTVKSLISRGVAKLRKIAEAEEEAELLSGAGFLVEIGREKKVNVS